MKPNLTATAVIGALLVSGLAASTEIPADPIPRPGSEPSLTTRALLEKTIFKVDVLTLELWLGPETVSRLTPLLPVPDDDGSREAVARIALDSRDAWAELVFQRGISLDQFLGGGILQQVAQGTRLDGREDLVVLGKAGDDQDPSRAALLCKLHDGLDAVLLGHDDVHQDDVGPQSMCLFHHLDPIAGFAHDIQIGLDLDEGA